MSSTSSLQNIKNDPERSDHGHFLLIKFLHFNSWKNISGIKWKNKSRVYFPRRISFYLWINQIISAWTPVSGALLPLVVKISIRKNTTFYNSVSLMNESEGASTDYPAALVFWASAFLSSRRCEMVLPLSGLAQNSPPVLLLQGGGQ